MMNKVTVSRDALLEKLRENRQRHAEIYADALDGYRDQVRDRLRGLLADFGDDDSFRALVDNNRLYLDEVLDLPVPEDHTDDYDLAIQMLEMSIDDDVTLTSIEFRKFVNDEWEWKHRWEANTAAYSQA